MARVVPVAHSNGFMIGRFAGSWMMKTIPRRGCSPFSVLARSFA